MNLKIEVDKKEEVLKVGDIVVFPSLNDDVNDVYILMDVTHYDGKYELRSLDGFSGACGRKSLDEMREFVDREGGKIYKSNSFELVLREIR